MGSGQIPAELVWFMLGSALVAVLTLVVVGIGVGGTIYTLTKRHLPTNRFVRVNMVLSVAVLGVAVAWWATLAIAHNIQGLCD